MHVHVSLTAGTCTCCGAPRVGCACGADLTVHWRGGATRCTCLRDLGHVVVSDPSCPATVLHGRVGA